GGGGFYESNLYRENAAEIVLLDAFNARHDYRVLEKMNITKTEIFRNKIFMDIGCGGGGYADFINGVAAKVILIEPNKSFAEQLQQKGYEVFSYLEQALEKYANSIDVITSWDVIEHVENPQNHMQNICELLASGGTAYIGTPSDFPVLRTLLGAKFENFLFMLEHPWIFSRKSLEIMAENCRFSQSQADGQVKWETKFYQRYGIGNLLAWLHLVQPKGDIQYNFISQQLESLYKADMAREETADYIVIEITK
ncbi:MAG: class I SAM-dependent methyltransferase, partial [Firmicutes bacterium]|nr:class I SAM-dependent methyltransferase [Bacillota bacterium]